MSATRPAWCDRLTADVMVVWRFVSAQTGIPLSHTAKALGLLDRPGGDLQVGVIYEQCNGVNLWMHTAIAPGVHLPRGFVRYCFAYPFDEIGVQRITGWVEASNAAALEFDRRLGFRVEARLAGAATDGGDVLLHVMRREDCRPLRWGRATSMAG